MNMKIGAQLYTIREHTQTPEDFDASMKKIREMGYQIVQLSGQGPLDPQFIRDTLDRYGLTAICSHRNKKEFLEDLEGLIRWHRITGCTIAGLGSFPGKIAEEGVFEGFLKDFTPVAARLREAGLTFALHNHCYEFQKRDGKRYFDLIVENTDLKFIVDVYWLAYSGLDPAKFISTYADRICALHYKDLGITNHRDITMLEVGQGNLDWDSILEASKKLPDICAFVEQDICQRDPFDCMQTSYDYLKARGFA